MTAITPYVSINAILYDLSTMVPEDQINKVNMREWAYRGLKGIPTNQIYQNKVTILRVIDHKFILPKDLKYIYQMAWKQTTAQMLDQALETIQKSIRQLPSDTSDSLTTPGVEAYYENGGYFDDSTLSRQVLSLYFEKNRLGWLPLRLSTNSFALALHCGYSLPTCPECQHEYTIDTDMIGTTTLKEGCILISYLCYPKDDDGDLLIPDDPDLKEAIFNYVMYRYWLVKVISSEAANRAAKQESIDHWNRYKLLAGAAAGNLNMPTLDQLENLRKQSNRLVPRAERYDSFFINLSNPESIRF